MGTLGGLLDRPCLGRDTDDANPACLRNLVLRFDGHLHGCANVAVGKHGVLIKRFQRVSH